MGDNLDAATAPEAPLRWGASWIEPGDYAEIAAIMDDAMPQTFEEWRADFLGRVAYAKANGYTVYRAPLRREPFVAWCAAQGLERDQAARQAFASEPQHWDSATSL